MTDPNEVPGMNDPGSQAAHDNSNSQSRSYDLQVPEIALRIEAALKILSPNLPADQKDALVTYFTQLNPADVDFQSPADDPGLGEVQRELRAFYIGMSAGLDLAFRPIAPNGPHLIYDSIPKGPIGTFPGPIGPHPVCSGTTGEFLLWEELSAEMADDSSNFS